MINSNCLLMQQQTVAGQVVENPDHKCLDFYVYQHIHPEVL